MTVKIFPHVKPSVGIEELHLTARQEGEALLLALLREEIEHGGDLTMLKNLLQSRRDWRRDRQMGGRPQRR